MSFLPGPLGPGVVVAQSMGQIDLFRKIFVFNMTICKKRSLEKKFTKKCKYEVQWTCALNSRYKITLNGLKRRKN